MTLPDALSLLLILIALAALPSTSLALVVLRTSRQGFRAAFATTLGIVTADCLFVVLALLGMALLADSLGAVFVGIQALAGCYLLGFALSLLRANPWRRAATNAADPAANQEPFPRTSHSAAFSSGLLITLADVKALLFYASLFPAFIPPGPVTPALLASVLLMTLLGVGGTKLVIAWLAGRVTHAALLARINTLLTTALACGLAAVAVVLIGRAVLVWLG